MATSKKPPKPVVSLLDKLPFILSCTAAGGMIVNALIKELINAADKVIKEKRFDDLMEFYTEDAVLVVKPDLDVRGKEAIKQAFVKIAAYFKNSLIPTQGKMLMIETEDTILVLSQTILQTDQQKESELGMDRRATYVYRNIDGQWLCAIDNSYGTSLLDSCS
jgi:uncharacterized protein (TIGR02246 family)